VARLRGTAYAKELLSVIHPNQIEKTPAVVDHSQNILSG
jgi:hypothetical protein